MHLRVVLHLRVGLALLASVGWATTFFLEVKAEVVLTRLDHGNRTVMRRPEPHAMQLLSQGTNVFTMHKSLQYKRWELTRLWYYKELWFW